MSVRKRGTKWVAKARKTPHQQVKSGVQRAGRRRCNAPAHGTEGVSPMREQLNPSGLCQCGCGKPTKMAFRDDAKLGWVKGEPIRFIKGHHARLMPKPPSPGYKVDEGTGCWVWQGSIDKFGYGRMRDSGNRASLAHRVYYERHVGPIPEGLVIDHLCRNRACVNPAHMEPVTNKENILRGEGMGARYARRTHCAKGHPLSGDNLYVIPGGQRKGVRQCRTCLRAERAAYKARKKASS